MRPPLLHSTWCRPCSTAVHPPLCQCFILCHIPVIPEPYLCPHVLPLSSSSSSSSPAALTPYPQPRTLPASCVCVLHRAVYCVRIKTRTHENTGDT
ncbi:hypothetical protein E2C01_059108 [Portunus trituberculatus]|uniref:Uncharacterized protein n=1 Tax=Portunus trituberculatus TaxID=210409 RepID=A0A5B7H5X8_PORTR|nr:hypothetical protein [Portunus trituberculatus]